MSLYTIKQEASDIIEKMLSTVDIDTGEILDEVSYIEAQKELSEKENQANESMEWVLQYRQNVEGEIWSLDTEIARLSERKLSLEKKSKSLLNYIEHFFKSMWGWKTITFWTFSLGYRKSTAVQIVDASKIPEKYTRYSPNSGSLNDTFPFSIIDKDLLKYRFIIDEGSPDKTAISKDIKDGAEIPGAVLDERQKFYIK